MLDGRLRTQFTTFLCVGIVIFISALFEFGQPINADVSTFIYCAQEYLFHDKIPYKDIIDINPPFSTWLFMPAVMVSHYLGFSPDALVMLCRIQIFGLIGAALLITCSILKDDIFNLSRFHKNVFLVSLVFIVFIGYAGVFGQREHLIVAFILPEILLACRASSNEAPLLKSKKLSITAGVLAWAAIAMKPHYIFALVLPEFVVLLRRRRLANCLRPENLTILVLGILYALIIVLYYPDIFRIAGNLALHTYGALSAMQTGFEVHNLILLGVFLLLRILYGIFAQPKPFDALLAGVIGSYFAYLSQGMGFGYQLMPREALSALWIIAVMPSFWPLSEFKNHMTKNCAAFLEKINIRCSIVALGLLTFSVLVLALSTQGIIARFGVLTLSLTGVQSPVPKVINDKERDLLHRYAQHKPVLFMSVGLQAFPTVVYEDIEVATRWNYLWPLPAELALPEDQQGAVARDLAEDIGRYQPELIFVDTNPAQRHLPEKFDYIAYFSKWPEFREQWQHYHPMPDDLNIDAGTYVLYRRE